MSTIPVIASADDLGWAIRRGERYVESRAFIARRAVELGAGDRIPSSWGDLGLLAGGVSQKERDKAVEEHTAKPDGSFPIRNRADLKSAIALVGQGDYNSNKRWIIKRARALNAVSMLPEDWGVTASAAERLMSILAAAWDPSLHPRDREGKFIDFHGLLNLFDGSDFGKPSMRAEAVGVRHENGKDVLTVRAKSAGNYDGKARAVGDEFDVPSDRVQSAPDTKAKLTHPVFKGQVKPQGEVIKGEPTDLKKAQDRADAAAAELADAEASGDKARITKARTSNTAAKKNLEKQQGLENQAGADLTAQLEESMKQLGVEAPAAPSTDPMSDPGYINTLRDTYAQASDADLKALLKQNQDEPKVANLIQEEIDKRNAPAGAPAEASAEENDAWLDGFAEQDLDALTDRIPDMYAESENDSGRRDLADQYLDSLLDDPDLPVDEPEVFARFSEAVSKARGEVDHDLPDTVDAIIEDGDLVNYSPDEISGMVDELHAMGRSDKADELDQAYADAGGYDESPNPDDLAPPENTNGPPSSQQSAASDWELANGDYLDSLPENARADIESALADEDYQRAAQVMDDNYEFGQGDAIDSFKAEVRDLGEPNSGNESGFNYDDPAWTDWSDRYSAELDKSGMTPDQGPEPYELEQAFTSGQSPEEFARGAAGVETQPTFTSDDPDIQAAFDKWAQDVHDSGGVEHMDTDKWIKLMVDHAQENSNNIVTWKADTPEAAAEAGTKNAQHGIGRDRLRAFPIGDPRQYGFGGYDVWHVNADGSKNGGRGNFPDKATADAYIAASDAEYNRLLQERIDAVPAGVKEWAKDKDPEVINQAMLNLQSALPEFDPQNPDDADRAAIYGARIKAMQEALDSKPTPKPDVTPDAPVEQAAAPSNPDSPQRAAIALSLGNSAINKGIEPGNLDSVFSASTPEDAHKAMAAEMTRLKLGGKQRARMRQLLDLHFGSDGKDSAKIEAAATADALPDDNPLKAPLAAKAAGAPTPSTPAPGPQSAAPSKMDVLKGLPPTGQAFNAPSFGQEVLVYPDGSVRYNAGGGVYKKLSPKDATTARNEFLEAATAGNAPEVPAAPVVPVVNAPSPQSAAPINDFSKLDDAALEKRIGQVSVAQEQAAKLAMNAKTGTPATNEDAKQKRASADRLFESLKALWAERDSRKAATKITLPTDAELTPPLPTDPFDMHQMPEPQLNRSIAAASPEQLQASINGIDEALSHFKQNVQLGVGAQKNRDRHLRLRSVLTKELASRKSKQRLENPTAEDVLADLNDFDPSDEVYPNIDLATARSAFAAEYADNPNQSIFTVKLNGTEKTLSKKQVLALLGKA